MNSCCYVKLSIGFAYHWIRFKCSLAHSFQITFFCSSIHFHFYFIFNLCGSNVFKSIDNRNIAKSNAFKITLLRIFYIFCFVLSNCIGYIFSAVRYMLAIILNDFQSFRPQIPIRNESRPFFASNSIHVFCEMISFSLSFNKISESAFCHLILVPQ